MKNTFWQYYSLFGSQIFFGCLFLVLDGLSMFVIHSFKDFMALFPFYTFGLIYTCAYSVFTFRKMIITNDAVEIKLGRLTLQKILFSEIQFSGVFVLPRARGEACAIFVSTKKMNAFELKKAMYSRKIGNNNIIFCDYYQKGISEKMAQTFPDSYSNERIVFQKHQ